MRKSILIMSMLLLVSILISSCTTATPTTSAVTEATSAPVVEEGPTAKIGVIFTVAGLGGYSFNDIIFEGVKLAEQELGIEYDYVEPKEISDEEIVQDEMASSGEYDLIICIGVEQIDALKKVAANYPDQKFAFIDSFIDLPNIASYVSREQEATFLVGALAALAKQGNISDKFNTGKTLGFIGGVDNPIIRRFAAGFIAGARYIDKDYNLLVDFVGGFNDPTSAGVIANTQNEKGADIIFHAAGASGMGLFQAAQEGNFVAIGVNLNQNTIAPDYIIASMIKKVDVAAYMAIKSVVDGTFTAGQQTLGLKDGGIGYTVEGSNIVLTPEILATLQDLETKVVSGEIVVPDTLEAVDAFIEGLQ